ncbi:hypothetical protein M426DRAFT_11503 [Hypoxylon sp. CI-4A]|nr:hypothetical protein M426DRAFT_11503 [Hypoxylon sp. CI-4A]
MKFFKFGNLLGLVALSIASPIDPQTQDLVDTSSLSTGDVTYLFTHPGFQFRRAEPLTSTPIKRAVQNHQALIRLPHHGTRRPRHSAAALFGSVQRDIGGNGYENVTSVNHYALEYALQVVFNGIPMSVVIDSGSADTWIKSSKFHCKDNANDTIPEKVCRLGPSFPGNFTGGPIRNQHFAIKYGDGESVQGRLGHMDVEFAGVTVPDQEVALASQGTWQGNNLTSGILGLAYPSLTSAYWGNDLDDDSEYLSVPYSPVFTSMVKNGLVEPYWVIAMARNSSLGAISVGGMPPIDVSKSDYEETPILITNIIPRESTAYQPSFYTIVPSGFRYGHTTATGQYPFILDTATSLIYLPPDLAEEVNAQFDPPATYLWYYGSYFTSCDATPPSFGIQIGQTTFWVNPKDMLNKEERDPDTGYCQTGIGNGGSGPYILGVNFLTNVVVSMNIGSGNVELWSHQFY